jgi:EmrB/QacA subfamily drug resistance transporter
MISETPDPRRWWALAVIGVGQLMIVLDATIVNVALPSMQADLGFSTAGRQWVVTAYTLMFGGLLLLGGRIADTVGRKRMVLIGATGFAVASAVGGAAVNPAMMLGARGAQGVFGAMLAPALLSTLTVTFHRPDERGKAFGIFSALAGSGAAIGLVLGGVLTNYLSWRWALYVNIVFAAVVVVGGARFLRESTGRQRRSFDVTGAALGTLGLLALVFGFAQAQTHGWGAAETLISLVVSATSLTAFVCTERVRASPLLPLRVVTDRNRAGSYLAVLAVNFCLFGLMFYLTFYLQDVLSFSPVRTGFAFLPMTAGIVSAAQLCARLVAHVAPRLLLVPGLLLVACGLLYLTRLRVESGYGWGVVPAMLLVGLGIGMTFMAGISTATLGVDQADAGVAGAMVNTCQQVGGSIGTALLNTVAARAAARYAGGHLGRADLAVASVVHGGHAAVAVAAVVAVAAAMMVGGAVNARPRRSTTVIVPGTPAPIAPSTPGAASMESSTTAHGGPAIPRMTSYPQAVPAANGAAAARPVLAGRVHDVAERPLSAQLSLLDPVGTEVVTVATDSAGTFAVDLAPGRYLVTVSAVAHAPKAAVIEVPASGVELDVTLLEGRELTGTVYSSGTPVVGALVTLVDPAGGLLCAARTDGAGQYRLSAPPAGTWTLAAAAPGAGPVARTVHWPQDLPVQDLALGSIARVRGYVRSTSGLALPETTVRLLDATGAVVGVRSTGEDGSFEFSGLPDGNYAVVAVGYPAVAQTLQVGPSDALGQAEMSADITLRPQESAGALP